MRIFTRNYLLIAAVFIVTSLFTACGGPNDDPGDTEIERGDYDTAYDIAYYTDVPPECEMGRALYLLERAKYPFHAVRAKPLPEFAELAGLQSWNAYAADNFDVRVYVLLFTNQAEGLSALEILEETGDEQGLYRRIGVNGALMFFTELDEEPDKSQEEYWLIGDYLSALAGEE